MEDANMKKIFLVFVLLLLIGFISGCKAKEVPTTPTDTTTPVETSLNDITGEIDDINTTTGSDYNIDDINLEQDMPNV
jgi:hypothetical protein